METLTSGKNHTTLAAHCTHREHAEVEFIRTVLIIYNSLAILEWSWYISCSILKNITGHFWHEYSLTWWQRSNINWTEPKQIRSQTKISIPDSISIYTPSVYFNDSPWCCRMWSASRKSINLQLCSAKVYPWICTLCAHIAQYPALTFAFSALCDEESINHGGRERHRVIPFRKWNIFDNIPQYISASKNDCCFNILKNMT